MSEFGSDLLGSQLPSAKEERAWRGESSRERCSVMPLSIGSTLGRVDVLPFAVDRQRPGRPPATDPQTRREQGKIVAFDRLRRKRGIWAADLLAEGSGMTPPKVQRKMVCAPGVLHRCPARGAGSARRTALLLTVSLLALVGVAQADAGLAAYERGEYDSAFLLWSEQARRGDTQAMYSIGWLYFDGRGQPQDHALAARWLRKAAERNHRQAQNDLAYLYEHGLGVPSDFRKSTGWYYRAATAGLPQAMYGLAIAYGKGRGVAQDDAEAARWMRRAAEGGNAAAQADLGFLLARGQGVPRSLSNSIRWYRAAALQGHARAENELGAMYDAGRGVERNYEEAVRWFRRAAKRGHAPAQYNLALMYERGTGVSRDLGEALRLHGQAATRGLVEARAALRRLEGGPTGPGPLPVASLAEAATLATRPAPQLTPVPDREAPVIVAPGSARVENGRVAFHARARDDSKLSEVRVDGHPVRLDSGGFFWVSRAAPAHVNEIVLSAMDEWGNLSRREVRVRHGSVAPTPPMRRLAPGELGRYHALVVGNDGYQQLPRLRTAVRDARAVSQILEQQYGFEVTHLEDATRDTLLQHLEQLRDSLAWNDNLLVYYSGHGWFDQATGRGYWQLVDAKPESLATWLPNDEITAILAEMPAKHVMVVSDSCFAGAFTRGIIPVHRVDAYLRRLALQRTRVALTSGGLEPVDDGGGGPHSVFAAAFLGTLASNAGILDATNLFAAVRRRVVERAAQTPEYGHLRDAGHEGGDFLFVALSAASSL